MNAGATPKVMTSARLSSCAPIAEVDFVRRATEPSIASKNMPMKTRHPATVSVDQPKVVSAIGLAA